jgi:hypothetical protein
MYGVVGYRCLPTGETVPINKSAKQQEKEQKKDRNYVAGGTYLISLSD